MILYDFECGTCGSVFELAVAADDHSPQHCPKGPCHGIASRRLGGHPAEGFRSSGSSDILPGSLQLCPQHPQNAVPVQMRPIAYEADGTTVMMVSGPPMIGHLPAGLPVLVTTPLSDKPVPGVIMETPGRGEDA